MADGAGAAGGYRVGHCRQERGLWGLWRLWGLWGLWWL